MNKMLRDLITDLEPRPADLRPELKIYLKYFHFFPLKVETSADHPKNSFLIKCLLNISF